MVASPITVTPAHRCSLSEGIRIQHIGGEAVLLNLASEQYFGLHPSARITDDLLALVQERSAAGLFELA